MSRLRQKLENANKVKMVAVVSITALISAYLLILASAIMSKGLSDTTVQGLIQVIQSVVSGIFGYALAKSMEERESSYINGENKPTNIE